MGNYTKKEAIKIIVSCAEKYRDELVDRTLLFVCQNKHKQVSCMEFSFTEGNYLHLTGVKVKRPGEVEKEPEEERDVISPSDFYSRCINHKLSPRDFDFADDGTTYMKLDVLPLIMNKNLSAVMIGDYNSSKPKLHTDKLAGGVKACMGFVPDEESGRYVPNTVLKENVKDVVNDWVRVIAIYRKPIAEQQYQELTYKAKGIDLSSIKLPKEYHYIQEVE